MQYTTHIKKTYIAPEMEIVEYEEQDIIAASPITGTAGNQGSGNTIGGWGGDDSKGMDYGFYAPIFEDDIDRELEALRKEEDKHYMY